MCHCNNCSFLINKFYTFDEMKTRPQKIHVALPVMDEVEFLPLCIDCIESQSYNDYHVVICVNQPDEWWEISAKKEVCERNKKTIEFLSEKNKGNYTIIDKSSKGQGWQGNKKGVGWARKTAMDHIAKNANDTDIILSLDADTIFSKEYFKSIIDCFIESPTAVALSNPYYHKLTGHDAEDKAILRYEIYMRNYAINMLLIQSPYAFTALGSAIALPVGSHKAIGGMTPKLSGEDFYFLQKLRKYGNIRVCNEEKVHPATRFSDRVFFGTGPAMIKGNKGDWESYPIYHHGLFNDIKKSYDGFSTLFKEEVPVPLDNFMKSQFRSDNIWQALRENNKDAAHFVRACHEKLDGLRILQYLKSEQTKQCLNDEQCLADNIIQMFSGIYQFNNAQLLKSLTFKECPVSSMDEIRNYLVKVEEILQQKIILV